VGRRLSTPCRKLHNIAGSVVIAEDFRMIDDWTATLTEPNMLFPPNFPCPT
jgi:hypothetical protein